MGWDSLQENPPIELLCNHALLIVGQRREHLAHVAIDDLFDRKIRRAVGELVSTTQRRRFLPHVHLQVREEIDCATLASAAGRFHRRPKSEISPTLCQSKNIKASCEQGVHARTVLP